MPFVVNQGIRIHYESIGNGPTLVMHHGTLGSGKDFIDCEKQHDRTPAS
jgi:hypothetical protein